MNTLRSEQLFADAQQIIPGGVNSPVRAFRSVGGQPRFIARAKGSRLYDVDGNSYLDYVLSWGPMILGHAPATVTKAIQQAAGNGTSYGAPTELEIQLATMIREALPSMEMVRLVSSGNRSGHECHSSRPRLHETRRHPEIRRLLSRPQRLPAGQGRVRSHDTWHSRLPGVPEDFTKHTLTAPYNDLATTEKLIKKHYRQLACIIVEPIAGNMGVIPPRRSSCTPCAS
jgi:glutamate-1-semialdehyde 2,1-aminomutase